MSRPHRGLSEAALLAQAKAAARQRLVASLGQAGGNVRDGAGHVGSLVSKHPVLAIVSAFAVGFIAVKVGRRVVRAIAGRRAQHQDGVAPTPVAKPRHGFMHLLFNDLLIPILTQRLMAFVSKPTETTASSQPPASSSSPDST